MHQGALRLSLWLALGVYLVVQASSLWRGAAAWESQPRAAAAFFGVLLTVYYILRLLLPVPRRALESHPTLEATSEKALEKAAGASSDGRPKAKPPRG